VDRYTQGIHSQGDLDSYKTWEGQRAPSSGKGERASRVRSSATGAPLLLSPIDQPVKTFFGPVVSGGSLRRYGPSQAAFFKARHEILVGIPAIQIRCKLMPDKMGGSFLEPCS